MWRLGSDAAQRSERGTETSLPSSQVVRGRSPHSPNVAVLPRHLQFSLSCSSSRRGSKNQGARPAVPKLLGI